MHVCRSPQKGALLHTYRKNLRPLSTQPHADGTPTYNGVRPGPPRGSLMTLLSVPQCLAAFCTILSTLAWVDQSPLSQRVSSTSHQGITSTIVTTSNMTEGRAQYKSTIPPRYGRGVGFMEAWGTYCILLWSSPRCQQFASKTPVSLCQHTSPHARRTKCVYFVTLGTSRLTSCADSPVIHAPLPLY